MPNSLRARLKKLVHKGELSEKDLERIIIRPVNNKSSNDDYISRQEAIDLFKNDEDADYCKWSTKGIISELEDLPSADFVSRWIPASEGLPTEKGDYLFTIKPYSSEEKRVTLHKDFKPDPQIEWFKPCNIEIVAWMPCPKEYNGG